MNSSFEYEDSFIKSPDPTSSLNRFREDTTKTQTVGKNISPGIISGRLTIKSINNVENQNIENPQETTIKKLDFKTFQGPSASGISNGAAVAA